MAGAPTEARVAAEEEAPTEARRASRATAEEASTEARRASRVAEEEEAPTEARRASRVAEEEEASTEARRASRAAEAHVAAALRGCAAAVARQEAAARAALAGWAPLLAALRGLAAQARAAQRLAWAASPLGASRGLRERLWRKQRGAAEAALEELGERRAELRAARDAVAAAVGAALRLYEERAAELGLEAALRRGPRCPALAEALEGLQDVERHYRLLYLESTLLLQRVSWDNLDAVEALPQAWERILERHQPHVVQDTLLKISLYVDNQ